MQHNKHSRHAQQEWTRAKKIWQLYGLSAPQLMRYARQGLIRTSHIRRPGQTRGVRFFDIGDIERLIAASVEQHSEKSDTGDNAGQATSARD